MSLLLGVNYVGGREDGCLTSPPLEWTGLHTLFARPSQFVVAQVLAGAATAAHASKGLLGHAHRGRSTRSMSCMGMVPSSTSLPSTVRR